MRFISLFAGIGGLDLGLERAGHQCVAQVELDPYCRGVLEKHWPAVPKWGDIREVRGDELPAAELIVGGFPCQPTSRAGKGRGRDDDRWLWPEYARLLGVLRPRYVIVENPPGLLGREFGDVLGSLAYLGFDAEWDSVPAASVGAPHLRERVFVVAYPHGQPLRGRPGHDPGEARKGEGQAPERERLRLDAGSSGAGSSASAICDPDRAGLQGDDCPRFFDVRAVPGARDRSAGGRWEAEPSLGRMVDGFPGRVAELRGLGNAVVPQVAEWIGRRLMEVTA